MKNGRYLVLVVDDEADLLAVVGDFIEFFGYEVISTTSAADALILAQTHEIDVLLTDVVMPEMSGISMVQTLRDRGFSAPVVVYSAYSPELEHVRDWKQRLNVTSLVEKPFNEETLGKALAEALGQ